MNDLRTAKSPDSFADAYRKVISSFDGTSEEITKTDGVDTACHAGCSYCCHFRVEAQPADIFGIADYIRQRFQQSEIDALVERLRSHVASIAGLSPSQHEARNTPCPLLVEGRCSVYTARPLTCRRFHSLSVDRCKLSYEHPENTELLPLYHQRLFQAGAINAQTIKEAYQRSGFDTAAYELGMGLLQALTNPAVGRRWRQGKKAFFAQPSNQSIARNPIMRERLTFTIQGPNIARQPTN